MLDNSTPLMEDFHCSGRGCPNARETEHLQFRFRPTKKVSNDFPPRAWSQLPTGIVPRCEVIHSGALYFLNRSLFRFGLRIKTKVIACEYTLGKCQWQRSDRDSEIVRPGHSPVCTAFLGNGERGVGGHEVWLVFPLLVL